MQRFNSALELSYHLHILIPDGIFVRDSDDVDHPPRFVALAAPSTAEVEILLKKLITRVERHLRKRGRLDDEAEPEEPALELFASQLISRSREAMLEPVPPMCARKEGYSLHAATSIRAEDR